MASSNGIPGGRPAGQVKKKAKVLVYGEPGSGKTAFALSWPQAVVFDLEGGADLYAPGLKLHWGAIPPYTVIRTKNPDELVNAINWLRHDAGKTYQTVVIDPVTVLWMILQDVGQNAAEARAAKYGRGTDDVMLTPRDWGRIKAVYRRAMVDLVNLPVNVVMTAHQADIMESRKDQRGNETQVKIGEKPDAEKKTGYWPDIVVKMQVANGRFVGIVEKVRGPAVGIAIGQHVSDISYAHFKPFLEAHGQGEVVTQQAETEAVKAATVTTGAMLSGMLADDPAPAPAATPATPPPPPSTATTNDPTPTFNTAATMLAYLNARVEVPFDNVYHLQQAIRAETGNPRWSWPNPKDADGWRELYLIAKKHADAKLHQAESEMIDEAESNFADSEPAGETMPF